MYIKILENLIRSVSRNKLIKEDILEEEVIKDEAGVIIQGNIVIAEEDIKDEWNKLERQIGKRLQNILENV